MGDPSSLLGNLPTELIQLIGLQLRSKTDLTFGLRDLTSLSSINKKFYRILRSPKFIINELGTIKKTKVNMCTRCGTSSTDAYNFYGMPLISCQTSCNARGCYNRECYDFALIVENDGLLGYWCEACAVDEKLVKSGKMNLDGREIYIINKN